MNLRFQGVSLPLAEFTFEVDTTFTAHVTGISGPSGSGKTTLLELIAGLRRPATGSIKLDDMVLADAGRRIHLLPEQRRIGYVPQDLALFPHLSVRKNLFFGYRPGLQPHVPPQSERVIGLLELQPLLDRRIHAISGGERQRVAIGRALLAGPRLLLLDEPLSNLDARLKNRILPHLQTIRQEFATPILYVSHLQEELAILCDETRTMERGRLAGSARATDRPENEWHSEH
jgi:molybdate transport system ATP-binding protein